MEALENVLGPSADDLILEEPESLLAQRRIPGQVIQHIQELTPQELEIELEISRSRSVQSLLNLVGLHQEKLNAINGPPWSIGWLSSPPTFKTGGQSGRQVSPTRAACEKEPPQLSTP